MPTVLDSNSTAAMGAIGAFPLLVKLIIAQTNGLAPDMSPWANLAAVGVIVGLFAWLLIYHIPAREKSTEARQDARDAASEKRLSDIQQHFLTALQYREDTSRVNAASGHSALSKLLDSQREVVDSHKDLVSKMQQLGEQQKDICLRLERYNKG